VIAEYEVDGSGADLHTTYTWGPDLSGGMQGAGGVGGLLAVHRDPGLDGGGARTWGEHFYPAYDGNGNIGQYLDELGAIEASYEYDPFGRVIESSGSHTAFRYRFSTKPYDRETGWLYYGFRYYDPVTGRWPSRDPIGERGGLNLYGFVGNDGVRAWDVLGLAICTEGDMRPDEARIDIMFNSEGNFEITENILPNVEHIGKNNIGEIMKFIADIAFNKGLRLLVRSITPSFTNPLFLQSFRYELEYSCCRCDDDTGSFIWIKEDERMFEQNNNMGDSLVGLFTPEGKKLTQEIGDETTKVVDSVVRGAFNRCQTYIR